MLAATPAAQGQVRDPVSVVPSQVIGVTGGTGRFVLHLKTAQGQRTLKAGDILEDGWVLTGLNAAEASFSKEGAVRRVGLNPSGALALPGLGQESTQVTVLIGPGSARGGSDAQNDAEARRAESIAALDKRIAALESQAPTGNAQYALDYIKAERARLAGDQ